MVGGGSVVLGACAASSNVLHSRDGNGYGGDFAKGYRRRAVRTLVGVSTWKEDTYRHGVATMAIHHQWSSKSLMVAIMVSVSKE